MRAVLPRLRHVAFGQVLQQSSLQQLALSVTTEAAANECSSSGQATPAQRGFASNAKHRNAQPPAAASTSNDWTKRIDTLFTIKPSALSPLYSPHREAADVALRKRFVQASLQARRPDQYT